MQIEKAKVVYEAYLKDSLDEIVDYDDSDANDRKNMADIFNKIAKYCGVDRKVYL